MSKAIKVNSGNLFAAQQLRHKPDSHLTSSTCAYCGVGCGVDIESQTDKTTGQRRLTKLQGTPDHPANFGRLCIKGSKLLETNGLDGRLLHPQVNGQRVEWPEAIDAVASKFKQVIDQHGSDAVAFYVSGQLLTEDYYVANKFMKGFIGSANIDTNSRLCMSSAVSAYKRAFGADAVPCCYEDLEQTELLVLIGSNAAWTHPVLFQRMERAKQLNPDMKVVFIDPRRTASCELADLHLALKSGSDVALFNGLLHYLSQQNAADISYIEENTQGYSDAVQSIANWGISEVADYCDVDEASIKHFYQLFANTDKVVSFYSMGVNQSTSGVDKASAIINCHLATGKIGREGCGPFSITGQPNAMGGREVGGLANLLAAHMDIDNPQHMELVQEYWQSPKMPSGLGLKAVDLFDEIAKGKVKAVWIMATNPLVSMPNRHKIEAALRRCEMVVVSDCVSKNDTLEYAHVRLPATGWSEKNGTVTNSERQISRQRALLPPSGEARHDWQIICDVAGAMGFAEAFDYQHPAQIFKEHAGLSAYKNNGSRDFDLSGLCNLSESDYNKLAPIQWPVNTAHPLGRKRLFSDGKFYTSTGKAQFSILTPRLPEQLCNSEYPFVLNSGRIRDQWHTMTRTGNSAQLTQHISQPFVAIHPEDALKHKIQEGDLIALSSAGNKGKKPVILPAKIESSQRKGDLFAPIHWSLSWSSSASIACLYSDANDAISGQPELKHAAVKVNKLDYSGYGQIFTDKPLSARFLEDSLEYWVKSRLENGFMYRFATMQDSKELVSKLQLNFPVFSEWFAQTSEYHQNVFAIHNSKLKLAAFFDNAVTAVNQDWINNLLAQDLLHPRQQTQLLRAEPDEQINQQKLICSCFKVSEQDITKAILNGCDSESALGEKLKCGTNCGSCKPELSQLITQHKIAKHADEQLITLVAL